MKATKAASSIDSAKKLPAELPLTQHAFEFAIYGCLNYGDEARIAEAAGKGPSYYSQLFNPEDPRESIFYRAAEDFVNWINKVDRTGGKKALAVFNGYVEAATFEVEGGCSVSELHRESNEAVQAAIDDKPVAEQQKELIESIGTQARRLRSLTSNG